MVLVIGAVTMADMAGACGAISGFVKINTPGGDWPDPALEGDYAWANMHGFRCR